MATILCLMIGIVLHGFDGDGLDGPGRPLGGDDGQKAKLLSKREDLERRAKIHDIKYIAR